MSIRVVLKGFGLSERISFFERDRIFLKERVQFATIWEKKIRTNNPIGGN